MKKLFRTVCRFCDYFLSLAPATLPRFLINKLGFFVTSGRISIIHRCVTHFYCNKNFGRLNEGSYQFRLLTQVPESPFSKRLFFFVLPGIYGKCISGCSTSHIPVIASPSMYRIFSNGFSSIRLQPFTIQAGNFFNRNSRRSHFISRFLLLSSLFCGAFSLLSSNSSAQDPVFTQAFLSPIYLNPAATGTGEYDLRVSGIYRRQWWTIPSSMNYMAVSVDKFVPEISGGLGLIATRSSEGYLNKSGVYATYAYNICGGTPSVSENGSGPKWFWTGGLQFGVAQTRVNHNKLVFADQLNIDGFIRGSVSSVTPVLKNGKFFPDFAAGTFFNYNLNDNNRLLAGFAAHHINRPDESITFSSDSIRSQLPVLWTGNLLFTHTNYNNTWSYSIAGIYYRQANNNSLQAGFEVTQNEYDVSFGLWYRASTNFKSINTVSATLSFSLGRGRNDKDKIRVGLAHDAEVGKKAYSYTSGSSEMGFVWDHSTYNSNTDNPCKPKISSLICPSASP